MGHELDVLEMKEIIEGKLQLQLQKKAFAKEEPRNGRPEKAVNRVDSNPGREGERGNSPVSPRVNPPREREMDRGRAQLQTPPQRTTSQSPPQRASSV